MNPIEEALAYKRLLEEFKLKQDDVAERVSKRDVYKRQGFNMHNKASGSLDSVVRANLGEGGSGGGLVGQQIG